MRLIATKSKLSGSVEIPGSKSHTIRAVAIASLAEGTSHIRKPLSAEDTLAAVNAYRLLGAEITCSDDWVVQGVAGRPQVPDGVIDVGNSGTTLYIALGSAALVNGTSVFTGDDQIRRRPAGALIGALNDLGARVESTRQNDTAPIIVRGPMKGGQTTLDSSKTSQYLTSLLINCPLAPKDTVVNVENLVEKPYIEMTLTWLAEQGVVPDRENFDRFKIRGGQRYHAFETWIPADFSSATFFMCAAAITKSEIILTGLDPNDTQADKAVVDIMAAMGAEVEWVSVVDQEGPGGGLRIRGAALAGG
ncbi:MAG: 3-phosphoshikimate 1-carboxyvinyltransferase, partial [Armatimonadota bacterium]